VAEFAHEVASAYNTFAEDVHRIVAQFREKSHQLKTERFAVLFSGTIVAVYKIIMELYI